MVNQQLLTFTCKSDNAHIGNNKKTLTNTVFPQTNKIFFLNMTDILPKSAKQKNKSHIIFQFQTLIENYSVLRNVFFIQKK